MNDNLKISNIIDQILLNNGGSPQDWKELLKLVNTKPDNVRYFCQELKNKVITINQSSKLIAIDIVDYLVDEGKIPLHTQIASKDFLTFIISLLKIKDFPEMQMKILYLIKKWGQRFESQKDILPNFYETYISLRNSNVVFPEKMEQNYSKYINDKVNNFGNDILNSQLSQMNINSNNYEINIDLNQDNYPKKFKKFVGELNVLLDSIKLANEMIDNVDPNENLDEGVRCIINHLRDLEKNLVMAIENQIDDEKLLSICLGINDDINQTFRRYDDYKLHKKPNAFISSFLTDYAEYNMNFNNIEDPKKNNPINLLDFNPGPSEVLNQNINLNQDETNKNKINDINDFFDIFK